MAACVVLGLLTIIATGGGGGGGGGDDSELNGVWRVVSIQGYDDDSGTCESAIFPVTEMGMTVQMYIRVSDADTLQYYYDVTAVPAGALITTGVYTCPDDDESIRISGNTLTDGDGDTFTYTLVGEALTVTGETDAGCEEVRVLVKAAESDISGAEDNCVYFGDDDTGDDGSDDDVSTDDDAGDADSGSSGTGETTLDGVWKAVSWQQYSDETLECEYQAFPVTTDLGITFDLYVRVENGSTLQVYYEVNGVPAVSPISDGLYTCTDDIQEITVGGSTVTGEDDGSLSYDLSGDTLTLTGSAEAGCMEKQIYERAGSSDISGAADNCTLFGFSDAF